MMKVIHRLGFVSLFVLSSCASTDNVKTSTQELFYGSCNVIELERITRELAWEKYPLVRYVLEYPYAFQDLGDRLTFYTRFPKTFVGGSPTTEFDKETCGLIQIYQTE